LTIDFEKLLAQAGLKMSYGKDDTVKQQAWAGIKTKVVTNGLQITAVEKNSPAWQAGLTIDDVIVAVEGLRMADKELTTRLKNFKPKDRMSVTFFRRDELVTRMISLGEKPKEALNIVPIENASKQQQDFFERWTGIDFPE